MFLTLLQSPGVSPPAVVGVPDGARRKRKPKRAADPYALAREYNRARAVADARLEQDIAHQHAPARTPAPQQPEPAEAAATAPLLTDALARAASAQQLMTLMQSASAAALDRQRAAEERRRRGLMAVLMLALD